MLRTAFGKDFLSKQSQDLCNDVLERVSEKKLLAIIDDYDIPTGAHSRGTAHIMAEIVTSKLFNIEPSRQESLIRIAALHDFGKLSVSSLILNTPGRLKPEDWIQMENHPIDSFHRYALEFGALEALPILLHHTMQLRSYPSREVQEEALSIHGLPISLLDDKEILTNALLLAIADNLEARYPVQDFQHKPEGTRIYYHRNYLLGDLPYLVKASFIEAGVVRKIGLEDILNKIITHFQKIILTNQNKKLNY